MIKREVPWLFINVGMSRGIVRNLDRSDARFYSQNNNKECNNKSYEGIFEI